MAILFNNVATATAGGSTETLLTVPVGAEVMVLELTFTPVGGNADLSLTLTKQSTGTPFNFLSGHTVADGTIFEFKKIAMEEGDTLSFSAAGNDINGLISYYQEGSATTAAGSLNPRGEYSALATYNRLDVVSAGGVSYIQLNNGISGDAPPSVNWMINAAPTNHTHPISEVAGLQGALDGKSATGHTHAIGDVTGLQTALDGKAASSHSHGFSDVTGLQTALDGKAASSHSHGISDVTGLQTALNGKATSAQGAKADAAMPKAGGDFTGPVKILEVRETVADLTGTTPTVNVAAGTSFALTTSGNTTFTFAAPPAGSGLRFGFEVEVTSGGQHTHTWPATVGWPGGQAPDAPASGETDVYVFRTRDGGASWHGALAMDNV